MGSSSLHQWEADTLFSAAEIVQDSADRMESLFRLLLHENSLVQDDHLDPRLLSSIEYHKRDLATILETAKWQLEDFERAVNLSAMQDKSGSREDVISRHKQFIIAIKEHINQIGSRMEALSRGDSIKKSELGVSDERERDVLASFLSGGYVSELPGQYDPEESNILRQFLDPSSSSGLKDSEIVECNDGDMDGVKLNGDMPLDHGFNERQKSGPNKLVSHYPTRLGSDAKNTLPEASGGRTSEDGLWDLEANEGMPAALFHENGLKRSSSRMNFLGFLSHSWTDSKRKNRKYAKKLKDGEEVRISPTYMEAITSQGRHMEQMLGSRTRSFQRLCTRSLASALSPAGYLGARFQRSPFHGEIGQQLVQLILATILTVMLLCFLLYSIG